MLAHFSDLLIQIHHKALSAASLKPSKVYNLHREWTAKPLHPTSIGFRASGAYAAFAHWPLSCGPPKGLSTPVNGDVSLQSDANESRLADDGGCGCGFAPALTKAFFLSL